MFKYHFRNEHLVKPYGEVGLAFERVRSNSAIYRARVLAQDWAQI
jgi:hypothetical protein